MPSPSGLGPRARRLLLTLAVLGGLASAVLLGVFPQDPLRRLAEDRLRQALGPEAEVRIGRLHAVPARLRLEVAEVRITAPAFRFDLARGTLQLAPRSLLGALRVERLELERPSLVVRPTGEGPPPPSTPSPLPALPEVTHLDVRGGRLEVAGGAGTLLLEDWSAAGSLGTGSLSLSAPRGAWRGEPPLPIAIEARLSVSRRLDVEVLALELRAAGSRLTAMGPLARGGALRPDLAIEGSLDVEGLARLAKGGPPASGRLELTARLRGEGTRLGGEAALTSARLTVAGLELASAELSGAWDAAAERGRLRLAAQLLGGTVEARTDVFPRAVEGTARLRGLSLARLPGLDAAGVAEGELRWKGDPARSLAVAARVAARGTVAGGREPVSLEGTADGTVSARGALDVTWTARAAAGGPHGFSATADARGTARGTAPPRIEGTLAASLLVPRPGEDSPAARWRADLGGRFSTDGRGHDAELLASLLDGSLRLGAAVRGSVLERLELHGERLDLAELGAGLAGRVRLSLGASGPLARPRLAGTAGIDALEWRGAALGPLEATLAGDGHRPEAAVSLPAQGVLARLALALSPPGPPRVVGRIEAADTPLGAWLAGPPAAAPETAGPALDGRITATLDLDLPVARLEDGDAALSVQALAVRREGMEATAGPFRLRLADRELSLDGLDLRGPGLAIVAEGRFALGDAPGWASGAIDARLRAEADLARLPVPEGLTLQGVPRADLRLLGTAARPRAEGAVRLAGVAAEGPAFPRLEVEEGEVRLEGDRLSAAGLRIALLGGSATLSGTVPFVAVAERLRSGPLGPDGEARLRLTWSGLRVEGLGATVAGEARLEGGLAGLDEPRLLVQLPATALRVEELPLTLEPLTVRLEGGKLRTEAATLRSDAASLRLDGVLDLVNRTVDAVGRGSLDLRAVSPFVEDAALRGRAELDIGVAGSLDALRPRGTLRVSDGALRLRALPQAISRLEGTVHLEEGLARLTAEAAFGGGRIALEGTAALEGGGGLRDVQLAATGREIGLQYPPGLRTRLEADLRLGGGPGALVLSGDVRVLRGLYDLDVALTEAVRAVEAAAAESPLRRAVGLDLVLDVSGPVLVRNDLARLEATGELRIRGDLEEPAPYGRLQVRPGGRLFVQGRELAVVSGSLAYSGTFDPSVALTAETQIADGFTTYDIRVSAGGTLGSPTVSLSSQPALSESQIVSLVATGRVSSRPVDAGAWLLGGQAATLFAGRVTKGLAATFGLDEITIRPDLVARETDPGARLTFGKRIGRTLTLIYSLGLTGPEARFLQLEARPGRNLVLTGQRRDDGLVTVGAGQRFRWGGAVREDARDEDRVRVAEVRFEGDPGLPVAVLRDAVRARPGRRLRSWRLQEDAERIRETLRDADFLEAEASARLDGTAAVFEVRAGPRYAWRVEGVAPPGGLDAEVRSALFEEEALEKGRALLLGELRRRSHLRAEVDARVVEEAGTRTLVFSARPGPRIPVAGVRFPGASALPEPELLRAAGGAEVAAADPGAARQAVEDAYRAREFFAAEVGRPRLVESASGLRLEIPVSEGPRARLAGVRFAGASLTGDDLRAAAALRPGEPYDEAAVTAAAARVRDHYLGKGYPAVRVRPERVRDGLDLAVVFRVSEGEALVVGPVEVRGARRTRRGLIDRQLGLRSGDPLDPRRLAQAERRILDLGVFSRAVIRFEPEDPEGGEGPRPARLLVEVEEDANRAAGYDLRWNDEERLTALGEGELRNLGGTALAVGARYRVGADLREARGSVYLPGPFPGADFTGSVFAFEQDVDAEGIQIVQRQRGIQVQQSLGVARRTRLLLGYRFRRNTTIAPDFTSDPIDIAGAEVSFVRDTRDNLLDAAGGALLSLNLELAPELLGADAPLVKGFAQALLSRPLGPFTWAQGYRLGLAWGLRGEPLIPFERFNAGGASSLRGFGTDEVGPRDVFGDPAGGEAVAIVNQELRWRHASGLGAAAFYDVGNVFETVRSMSLDLRHTLGLGLRWLSPIGLLRLDVGFPLDRQEGEKRYRLFYGLGQAF